MNVDTFTSVLIFRLLFLDSSGYQHRKMKKANEWSLYCPLLPKRENTQNSFLCYNDRNGNQVKGTKKNDFLMKHRFLGTRTFPCNPLNVSPISWSLPDNSFAEIPKTVYLSDEYIVEGKPLYAEPFLQAWNGK